MGFGRIRIEASWVEFNTGNKEVCGHGVMEAFEFHGGGCFSELKNWRLKIHPKMIKKQRLLLYGFVINNIIFLKKKLAMLQVLNKI